jgi:serine/threonine protein kinase/tetratricopeptide (TPR) repeat protein
MASGDFGDSGATHPPEDRSATNPSPFGAAETKRALPEDAISFGDLEAISRPVPRASGGVADLDEFKRVVVELGLIAETELGAYVVDPAGGVLGLARALVRAGRITPYQSAAIYQKKSRGLLVGRYFILDKLGQGGMGVVFKARHRTTGKIVALKILPPSFARDRQALSRFTREIEAAGRLNHPNLVAALDANLDRGVHFLVMEYVEGRDLDRVVQANGPLPVVQAVDCLIQAAQGLDAAHAQGIIHRDIKPGNLMLDGTGKVRVLDLGLARIVEAANPFGQAAGSRLTQSGMYMGTVDFMAPEQAEDSRHADLRADIYSLGCTLYFLLTGRTPFEGETVLKRLMAHQVRPAPALRAIRLDVSPALESAYQKMMAKNPADRPGTMTAVIALLESARAAAAQSAAAPTEGPRPRPELMVFNEPLKWAAAAETVVNPSSFPEQAETAQSQAQADLRLEDLAIDVRSDPPTATAPPSPQAPPIRQRQYRSTKVAALAGTALFATILAGLALFSGTGRRPPDSKLESGATDPPSNPIPLTAETRRTETVSPRIKPEIPRTKESHREDVRRPEPSPSIANHISPPRSPTWLISPERYVETARLVGHTGFVEQVKLLPDGKTLFTASQDNTARLWDMRTGREVRRFGHPAGIRAAALLPDGRRAVTGCNDGYVRLWDLETGRELRRLAKHDGAALTVAVAPDGRSIVSGGNETFLRVVNVDSDGGPRQLAGQASAVWSIAISADGQRVLAGGYDGGVRVGNSQNSDPLSLLDKYSAWAYGLAFAPDDQHAVSSCIGQLTFWDLSAKNVIRQCNLERRQLPSIVLADSHRVVFCSHYKKENDGVQNEGGIGTWEFESNDPPRIIQSGPPGHLSLALLPEGAIATGDVDGFVRIWEPSAAIARAHDLVRAGKKNDSLPEYAKAIAQRPDDARLRVEHGRLLAELGRARDADAEFTRAVQLAPENLPLFFDAGWWIAGPYSPNFELGIDSISPTDPSKPLPPVGRQPRQWRGVSTKAGGMVDMTPEFASYDKNVTGYAMTYVYSATEREVVLLIGTDEFGRVWLNGRLILDSNNYTPPGANPIEVTLRPGRNIIVARIVNTIREHALHLRISDAPQDFLYAHCARGLWEDATRDYARAMTEEPGNQSALFHHRGAMSLAQTRRWKDAVPAYRRSIAANPGDIETWRELIGCELALDDLPAYRSTCREMVEKFAGTKNTHEATVVAWAAMLAPGAVSDYRRVLNLMKPLASAKLATRAYLLTYAALLYRDGQIPETIHYLKRSFVAQKGTGTAFDWVFLALAEHRARQPGAISSLSRANNLAREPAYSWLDRIEIDHLLKEAARELRTAAH